MRFIVCLVRCELPFQHIMFTSMLIHARAYSLTYIVHFAWQIIVTHCTRNLETFNQFRKPLLHRVWFLYFSIFGQCAIFRREQYIVVYIHTPYIVNISYTFEWVEECEWLNCYEQEQPSGATDGNVHTRKCTVADRFVLCWGFEWEIFLWNGWLWWWCRDLY